MANPSDILSVALWAANLAAPVNGVDAWVENIDEQMRQAAKAGARLLMMPEYAAEQWLSFAPRRLEASEEIPWLASRSEAVLSALKPLPARYGIALLAGTMPVKTGPGREGAPPYVNRAHLLLPDGRVVVHDKLCLTPPEKDPDGWDLSAGDTVTVVEWEGLRIATLVCLDIELPAIAARLAALAPDLILVPSQTETLAGVHRVFGCARARATELFAVVCAVGCVGAVETGQPRGGYVSGAAVYLPSDAAIGHTGVWDEMPPVDKSSGPGPVLIARDIPLGRIRDFRREGAEVWPGAWDAGHVRFVEA
jgi:predicted amidohydrolase